MVAWEAPVVEVVPCAKFSVRAFVSELSLPFINSFKIFKYKTIFTESSVANLIGPKQ